MKHLPLYPQLPTANTATGVQPLPHNKSCTNCPLCAHTPAGQRCLPPRGETGDILVVLESPEESERRSGEAGTGGNAQTILRVLERLAPGRKVAVTYAIGCSIPRDREEYDVYAAGCRPYLASAIQAVQPKIVLLFGSLAGLGVLGRTFQPMSVRSGYGWLLEENKNPIPCFFFPSVSEVRNNDLLQRAVDEDIKSVCNRFMVQPVSDVGAVESELEVSDSRDVQPLPLAEQYSCIEDGADAELAWELLSISETLIATDTETSGVMHEDEFYVVCIAVSDGTNHFLFPRRTWTADETAREYLGCILELLQHTSWNGQYDYCAIKSDKTLGFELNLASDARLKRKLYEADARGSLEVAAELVGMGGHKEEMQGQVAEICDDLRKYALSFQKTPTGKTRTWKGSKHFQPTDIPQLWLEQLTDGMPPERFAYGFVRADVLHRYCVLDALATARLEQKYHSRLSQFQDGGLLRIWNEVTYPAMKAYCRMRMNGLPVSKPGVESFKLWLEAEMATTLGQIHGTAPGLNPTSNPQVVELLEKLGIRSKRKTGSGKPSASKEVLEDLEDKHPVIGKILRYRMLQKIHGTYAVGMLPYIRSTGCVHSSFLQDGTECMPAGELVLTDRGYIPVESVKPGQYVLTHRGRPGLVEATNQFAPSAIYEVQLSNGLQLRTTGNHMYRTADGGWLRADSLTNGVAVSVYGKAEEWRRLAEWPDYEVSSWGRVRHYASGRIKQQTRKDSWGHLKVTLSRNGSRTRGPDKRDVAVHRLVIAAFSGVNDSLEVRHVNGTAWDNNIHNLIYGSSIENKADARVHGTMSKRNHTCAKLTNEIAAHIRSLPRYRKGGEYKRGGAVSDTELAHRYGVTRELIRDVRNGKRWCSEDHILGKETQFGTAAVVSVRKLADAPTYGLTVTEDHSHITAGIVTHNTGRPSAAEPNTLNLVKGRDEETRMVADLFRACFAAPPGWTLIEADEKQIEIRLAADLSADPEMCNVISSGLDFHKASAEKFAVAQGRDPATVTELDREQAKTSNFAAVYEIPAELGFMLSMRLKIPRDEADKLGKALFASFTRLRAWMEEEYAAARKVGYARTYWMGNCARRRPLWGLGHNPKTLTLLEDALSAEKLAGRRGYYDKNAARSTYNTPVQGSAVDIVASMLWPVQQWLDANTDGGKLILHVYDSIMVLVRDKDVPATVAMLRRLMTAPGYTKHVPLDVDIKTGKYWNALVKFKPC